MSKYDSESISDEKTKTMMEEIKEAGIRPGEDLKTALEDAGFELKPPPGGPGGGRPPMGMGGAMGARSEPPQFMKDFMEKVQSGEITEDEVTEFVKNVQSQQQQYTGVLFDQAV